MLDSGSFKLALVRKGRKRPGMHGAGRADGGSPTLPRFSGWPAGAAGPFLLEQNREKIPAPRSKRFQAGRTACRKDLTGALNAVGKEGSVYMRAALLMMAVAACGLSGCWVRCSMPLNCPPYDPAQYGRRPPDPYCVTNSYTCLAEVQSVLPAVLDGPAVSAGRVSTCLSAAVFRAAGQSVCRLPAASPATARAFRSFPVDDGFCESGRALARIGRSLACRGALSQNCLAARRLLELFFVPLWRE